MFSETQEKRLKEVTELYGIVKETILFCEETDPKKNAPSIQVLNELRNGFDHLMRIYAVHFKIKDDSPGYIDMSIDKVYGHLYRAGYDSLDWTSLILRKSIIDEINKFSLKTRDNVFPEYHKKIRVDLGKIDKEISEIRSNKDVAEANMDNFMSYVKLTKRVIEHHQKTLEKMPSMIEYEERLKKQLKTSDVVLIVTGVIIGIILMLIGKFVGIY